MLRHFITESYGINSLHQHRRFVAIWTMILLISSIGCHTPKVDFNSQIRPIINTKCISCHGGVKQSGGFSLLFESDALAATESGEPAIIPGDPDGSELMRRLTHHDPEVRMPYEKEALSKEEIELMRTWIAQGAKWERHWAYVPPQEQVVPGDADLSTEHLEGIKNNIDRFIRAKLKEKGLSPSPEADCASLARRVSLDLTGLPPSPERLAQFCANPSDEAYSELVTELLASPAYGERWAAMWMDLARYADTKGYERDPHREIWRYRDWVIQAFNENMPFDQFTVEQLAGDLLDQPAEDQYIATAFHRNTMTNDEGGTDNEEYRVAAVIDRVNTTWEVWMGTSFGCVQCHSHPYDPIRHDEFYRFMSIFNQSADADVYAETPVFKFYGPEEIEQVEQVINWVKAQSKASETDRSRRYREFLHITEPKIHAHTLDSLTNAALADTKFLLLRAGGYARMPVLNLTGQRELLINIRGMKQGGVLKFTLDGLEGPELGRFVVKEGMKGYQRMRIPQEKQQGEHRVWVQFLGDEKKEAQITLNWFALFEGLPGQEADGFEPVQRAFMKVLNTRAESVPIMKEQEGDFRRNTHVFTRGSWTNPGARVKAGVPASLAASISIENTSDRLALAQWIISPENTLTARVMVNRFWEQLMGRGIVETLEDLGTQGTPPSHPELLDWLALRFRDDFKWDIHALLREIVMSATYRQSVAVSAELAELDPQNRLWARGVRMRLSAEQVRDQALAVSGLLSSKMYGKSVMPPQPEGVWKVVYNGENWTESTGEDRYRRAVYTYWRRTSPYPSFMSFDSPSREVCTSRRIATNTPLQALVTLNDPVYLEAALALALNSQAQESEVSATIERMYQRAILQPPSPATLTQLKNMFETTQAHYIEEVAAQQALLAYATFPLECEGTSCADLAALAMVANTIMNLDAFITKE